jgi:uncharacterized damage-inducible protein DinB
MIEQALPLITFYQGWETYQHSLVETIAPLSTEHLATPVASHHWPIGRVTQHILSARVLWFQTWMGEGSPDLASIIHWDEDDQPLRPAAELVATLEATWQMIAAALARWTPADLGHVFPAPSGLTEAERHIFPERTRQWIIWHVFEHEIHHGGELSLVLGRLGLEGVYG